MKKVELRYNERRLPLPRGRVSGRYQAGLSLNEKCIIRNRQLRGSLVGP